MKSHNLQAVLLLPVCLTVAGRAAEPRIDFAREVLPILSENCFQCHGPDEKARKAKLRLDVKEGTAKALLAQSNRPVELLQRVTTVDESTLMPPPATKKKLTNEQVTTLRHWIEQGASWGTHWAFEAPRRPAVPMTKNHTWPHNPVDQFILARLEKEGLQPAPEADRVTLLRRLAIDLTGLPPTPEEVDTFLADRRPQAYEHAVDRLLASPRYGERMAWDWLDAARYADSSGFQGDPERTMWPWRDWVVQAFNRNMPYDQFTREQLAGDLLPQATLDQKLATGFNRNHMHNGEGGRIAEETRVENVFDRLETTGTLWLGLTLNCARCHDHKFDPITQREYYQLSAYFNNTSENGSGRAGANPPTLDIASEADRARVADLKMRIAALAVEIAPFEKDLAKPPTPEKLFTELKKPIADRTSAALGELAQHFGKSQSEYAKRLEELRPLTAQREQLKANVPKVMVMDELPKPRDTFILLRGNYNKPGEKVEPGVPTSLPRLPGGAQANRLALVDWILDPQHPLTARVTVNRLWLEIFGSGLVKSVEDFGVQGDRPSHPELLDWLAIEFVASGWDVKRFQRLLLTSATYRQSSRVMPATRERDPENRLLARGPRYRMPSWMLRDYALSASGLLAPRVGGAPVRPYQPPGIWEEATFGNKRYTQDHGESLYRRSLYTFWRRIVGPTLFFDNAARQSCTVKQFRTNTPLHALATLNDVTYIEAARALAQRVLQQRQNDDARLELAFRYVLTRRPSNEEATLLRGTLARCRQQFETDPAAAKKLLAVGEMGRDEKLSEAEHAAYTVVTNLLFNLDEALSKE